MSCVAHQVPRRENRRSNASVLRNSDTMGPPSSQSPMMRSRRGSVASACSVLQEKGGSCSPLVSKKGRNSTPVRSGNSSPAGNNCAAPRQATRCSSQRQEMRQGKNGSTKHGTNSNSHVMSTRGKEKQVPDSHHANNNSVSDESDSAQDSEEFTQLITPDAALSYADLLLQDKTTRKLLLDEPDVAEVLDTALREEVYNAFYQAMQVHQGSISVAIKEQELDELELRNGLVLQVLKVYLKLSMYRDVATLENIQNSKGNKSSVAWEGFTPVCNEVFEEMLELSRRALSELRRSKYRSGDPEDGGQGRGGARSRGGMQAFSQTGSRQMCAGMEAEEEDEARLQGGAGPSTRGRQPGKDGCAGPCPSVHTFPTQKSSKITGKSPLPGACCLFHSYGELDHRD
ncbi:hypothetical protein CBR_g29422 [Chara braunii]|uniref:Uncharacterized protein n=1 Tax=Chara braunii TaxID=69332 RepID=A0A388LAC4_CHABU|nr:hypothetical protein CBR_g29422 [Chara braunii]|eukprot:GBG79271.1 hypothetical protein CBR_g29422 [Chara braunii]